MSDPLGLSVGVGNIIAARVGSAPITRRSVLTLFGHRPPEIGAPEENPNLNGSGLVLRGFIERIGDPAPLVAPDGSTHRSDALAVEALDAMARTVGNGPPAIIAVPGYWGQNAVAALREALRPKPVLAPGGVPPALVSDATTALAALYAKPGFPRDGVIALCDFGAGGTSVTLTDAAANFRHIGETVRYTEFSGNEIDQAILSHLPAHVHGGDSADTAGTEPLAPPTRLLDECRRAKERLSSATVAFVPADTPGISEDIRLSRTELENLISSPLEGFVTTVQDLLQRNEVPTARLAAVATVGGGACIPLVTRQLEERLQVPVVSSSQPTLSAAIGAAVLADQRPSAPPADPPTTIVAAATTPTELAADPPTDIVSSAWAAEAARAAAGEASADGDQSATYRALAWSQEASGNEPLPYHGDDASGQGQTSAPAPAPPKPAAPAPEGVPWYKRPGVTFSLAAAAAVVALLGVALVAFKLSTAKITPVPSTSTVSPSHLPSVGTLPPPSPSTTETTPSPAPSSTESPVQAPPPSTTQRPTTTTTVPTTTVPTTTMPTTTWPTTTSTYPNYPAYPTYPTYPPVTTPPTSKAYLPPWVPGAPPYGR